MKILAFGEILWDIIQGEEHLGGAAFNFIAHAAQCGNSAYIISRVGKDPRGIKAYSLCKLHGVHDKFVQWDEKLPTGIVEVTLKNGQPDYEIIANVAWDAIAYNDTIESIADEKFDAFYFGSLAQRADLSAKTLQSILKKFTFKHVFYDVNLRKSGYSEEIIKRSLSYCTILKLNHEEVPAVSKFIIGRALDNKDFCVSLRALYPKIELIVITAAEKGCYVFHNDRFTLIPGFEVTVSDAVGAGDSFSAAFLHVFVKTRNSEQAARVANEVGAYVATQRGALPLYTKEIIEHLNDFGNVVDVKS